MSKVRKICTIPNILSLIRICLIPLIVYLYLFTDLSWLSGIFIILSGLTDMIDGYIARKFNQISDLGKILDPIADKLTLLSILICVTSKYNSFIILLGSELVKDLLVAISSYYRINRNKEIHCANWEGKVCTVLSYLTVITHIFIPFGLKTSAIIIISVSSLILLLGIKYSIKNFLKISGN